MMEEEIITNMNASATLDKMTKTSVRVLRPEKGRPHEGKVLCG